jgi:hypothetical protein
LAASPGNIAAGATVTGTGTVAGANLGDEVRGSYSGDLSGASGALILTAFVTAANSVKWMMYNPTGSAINAGAGAVRVWVEKPVNYTAY